MAASAPTSAPTSQPFDVKSTGALGDGEANDTAAIQKAIDACADAGGGVVSIPAGTFCSGSLFLKSHVTLQLQKDAILQGSTDDADYPVIDTRIADQSFIVRLPGRSNAVIGEAVRVTWDAAAAHWFDLSSQRRIDR